MCQCVCHGMPAGTLVHRLERAMCMCPSGTGAACMCIWAQNIFVPHAYLSHMDGAKGRERARGAQQERCITHTSEEQGEQEKREEEQEQRGERESAGV